jgi:hypothetical protein
MSPSRSSDEWNEIVRLVRAYALRKYGWTANGITIHSPYPGVEHLEPFPAVTPQPGPRIHEWASGDTPRHLSDFRAVYWPGLGRFNLSEKRAHVVKQLWEAMEDGTWEVQQDVLLRRADSDGTRLVDLFKGDPSWGVLVVKGQVPGSYRLPPLTDDGGE